MTYLCEFYLHIIGNKLHVSRPYDVNIGARVVASAHTNDFMSVRAKDKKNFFLALGTLTHCIEHTQ